MPRQNVAKAERGTCRTDSEVDIIVFANHLRKRIGSCRKCFGSDLLDGTSYKVHGPNTKKGS